MAPPPPPSPAAAPAEDEVEALAPPHEEHPFAVVGIGASAGGLEAFSALLRRLPATTDLAIVIVQHLARGHQSLLVDLLKQTTSLAVVQAHNGQRLEARHVYVIPPDARMTVTDGHLSVVARPATGGADAPIDHFLRSLAEHYREKAVGVILTGGAHDGALGIREVKAAGGITFAQEPAEATMDSMPRAAIATGAVDLVLPVARIGDELARLAEHPFLNGAPREPDGEGAGQTDHLRRLFQLLRRASGVDFSHYRAPTVMRRIQRRMALHRVASLEAYVKVIQEAPPEVERLYEDILIHVTSFFREPESFEVLKERILPAIIEEARAAGSPVRLWVPGCSSGEEVYSLAMVLDEILGTDRDAVPVQIFGTDVSQKMIDRARAGIYPETVAGDLGPERLRRFFVRLDGNYRISKTIRERCVFARQDITRDPPFSRLQLVVCRNLLIYLDQTLQRKVIQVFHYALRPSGHLMLGRSETPGARSDLFTLVDKRFKIYRRKPGTAIADLNLATPVSSEPLSRATRERRTMAAPAAAPARPEWDVQGEANRLILDRYGPPGVIVDGASRIVRTRGRTSPYLELPSGDASLDLLKMTRPGLTFGLRSALDQCRARGLPVRKEGLRVSDEDQVTTVNLSVTPIGADHQRHFLVLFEAVGVEAAARDKPAARRADRRGKKRAAVEKGPAPEPMVRQLEEELEAGRLHMQAVIHDQEAINEELQSANEEVLSANEELQSTNEELDTAREELQSTNEELSTLNEELHGRNEELSRVNSDLLNLLASVHIPIVIVTADLKLRRFTPAAERLLNLIAADVGRPIGHIKPNIHCPDLEAVITEVIDTVTIREREVEDHDGAAYTLRVRPYKNVDNRIDGAVLTLFEISDARTQAADLRVAREAAASAVTSVRDPVLLLDGTLRVQKANRAFLDRFAVGAAELEGRSLYELAGGQWNLPDLRRALQEVLLTQRSFEGLPVTLEVPGHGPRALLLDGRGIEAARPGAGVIVLTVSDPAGGPRY